MVDALPVTRHERVPETLPAFYYDLGSPECYLAAERILQTLPVACEWRPVLATGLRAGGGGMGAWRCPTDRQAELDRLARTAERRGLQPVRWPRELPFDSSLAQRAATYAKSIGRAVAFSLAAFRQAYAGGRDLSVPDNVLIAAAACEMHPAALLKAVETRAVRGTLARCGEEAATRGVRSVPAVWAPGGEVFHGDHALEAAAAALGR